MTNSQLILSIGIPSVLVVLSWIHNNTRLSRLEMGFDNMGRRMDALVETTHKEMTSLRDSIHRDMIGLHERLAVVESKQAD